MKRLLVMPIALLLVIGFAAPARADHLNTDITIPAGVPVDHPIFNDGAIRFIANLPASNGLANPLGEIPPFVRDGRSYMATGSSRYGLQVVDITDPFRPALVSTYSATFACEAAVAEAFMEGNGNLLTPSQAYENDPSWTPDGRIAVLGMDAGGRCHDPAMGGIELIDLSDVKHPRTLALTRNVGEAHSVGIDPVRPWLAWISGSDFGENDFIDIVDFRTCLGGVAKKDACRPVVARAVFDPEYMKGVPAHATRKGEDAATDGCHDIRIVGDLLYCGALGQTSILDISKVVDAAGNLTGTHMTSGKWACPLRDAVRAVATVTDCSSWSKAAFTERNAEGANVEMLSLVEHDGSKPAALDVEIAHQAEPTSDGRIMFVTDERGGGLSNFEGCPGGGLWFYDIRDKRNPVAMQFPDGSPAVYRTQQNLPGTAHGSCTIHYGQQFGNENILTFAWYLNGLRVIRFEPDFTTTPATIAIEEVGAYLPGLSEMIQAKPLMRNPNNPEELIIYTSDTVRGLDVLGIDLEKILLRDVTKLPGKVSVNRPDTKVLGRKTLARTGLFDPMTIGMLLMIVAAFITRRLKAVR